MEELESIKKAVGSRIRELRKAAGYRSVEVFADRVGVSSTSIYELERGENWVSSETLDSLARVLRCPVSALFQEMGIPTKPAKLRLFEFISTMDEAEAEVVLSFAERTKAAAKFQVTKPEPVKEKKGKS